MGNFTLVCITIGDHIPKTLGKLGEVGCVLGDSCGISIRFGDIALSEKRRSGAERARCDEESEKTPLISRELIAGRAEAGWRKFFGELGVRRNGCRGQRRPGLEFFLGI